MYVCMCVTGINKDKKNHTNDDDEGFAAFAFARGLIVNFLARTAFAAPITKTVISAQKQLRVCAATPRTTTPIIGRI